MLRVANWKANYEARDLGGMPWIKLQVKWGDSYLELIEHPDGIAHYGAWVVLLSIATRMKPKGVFVRDGNRPHTASSLARMGRVPEPLMTAALQRLISIGWIEDDGGDLSNVGQLSTCPVLSNCEKSRNDPHQKENKNEKENNKILLSNAVGRKSDFSLELAELTKTREWFNSEFWPSYPRKAKKARALQWCKSNLVGKPELRDMIISALEQPNVQQRDTLYPDDGERFCILPDKWLSGQRWEDGMDV